MIATPLNAFDSLLLLAALLATAFYVFARVRSDYRAYGRLSRTVAALQTGFFCLYALSSYAILDARLAHVQAVGPLLLLALVLILFGALAVIFSMPFLGRRSFGQEVGSLRTDGLYRYSRNPQLVGGFLFVAGYALLWPSWPGAAWVSLWPVIAQLMVRAEEEHLARVFGAAYREYCARTPRYLGWRTRQVRMPGDR